MSDYFIILQLALAILAMVLAIISLSMARKVKRDIASGDFGVGKRR